VLGRSLFRDDVLSAFDRARARGEDLARRERAVDDDLLHVLLFVEAGDVATLRWERLAAPVAGKRWSPLALEQKTPFSLYLPSTIDRQFRPFGRLDLRALVVAANPSGLEAYRLAPFDAEAAVAGVREALGAAIPCDVLGPVAGAVGPATLDAVCERITAAPYTILHVVGHGAFPTDAGEPLLYLAKPDGTAAPVPAGVVIDRLGKLRGARGLPHLAFLSCCEVAAPEAEGALGGLAQRLVRDLGMPAVVAMTDRVTVQTATALARTFYTRLRDHGAVDRALSEAYAGLATRPDVAVPVPVLYSRLGARPLFSNTPGRALTPSETAHGLDRLTLLLPDRAPVLQPAFDASAGVVRGFLGTDESQLSPEAKAERAGALAALNELCREVVDLSFKALALGQDPPPYDARCPFRGLYPFTVQDRQFFFGREPLTDRLMAKLEDDPFLAVLGPSGSGKSSIVLAGLVPRLCPGAGGRGAVVMTPGDDPVARLDAALATAGAVPAVLVVDQFEEVFTLCTDPARRGEFIGRVLDFPAPTRVVLTMRADFWGDCAPYPRLRERMLARQDLIPPMDEGEMRRAVESQAVAVKLRFEANLASQILDDVRGEPGAMPVMHHALLELWKRRHGRWLRATEYSDEDKVGGVRRAISRTADALYLAAGAPEREEIRFIFERLARIDVDAAEPEARRDTRRRASLEDLTPAGGQPPLTRRVVTALADAKLVVTSAAPGTGRVEVEVAHEALIRHWARLRAWLDEVRDSERLVSRIRDSARGWRDSGGDRNELSLRGNVLAEAEALASARVRRLAANEAAYITACRAYEGEQARARARRRRAITAGLSAGLVIASGLAAYAWVQREKAVSLAKVADDQRGKAVALAKDLSYRYTRLSIANSQSLAEAGDAAGSIVWAANALANDPADDPVHRARVASALREFPLLVQVLPMDADIASMAISPDGRAVAIAAGDIARVYDIDTGDPVCPLCPPVRYGLAIVDLAFSPDGKSLATLAVMRIDDAYLDAQVKDERAAAPDRFKGLDDKQLKESIRTNLASHRKDAPAEARVWRLKDGQEIARWSGTARSPELIRYSHDGLHLLIVGSGAALVWEPASGAREPARATHWGGVIAFADFRADGRKFATTSNRGGWKVWDVDGKQVASGTSNGVSETAAFSPDGSLLATANPFGTAYLWDVKTRKQVGRSIDHGGKIRQLAFSPDGRKLVTAGGTLGADSVRLWDVRTGDVLPRVMPIVLNHPKPIFHVSFSPDGRYLLTVSRQPYVFEGEARVWDWTTGQPVIPWVRGVHTARWFPDGRRILTAGMDRTARVWDVFTASPVIPFDVQLALRRGAVSRDGTKAVVADERAGVRVYDLATGSPSSPPLDREYTSTEPALSPDNSRLLVVRQNVALVFDLKANAPLYTLKHVSRFSGISNWGFSPGGERLLIAGGLVSDLGTGLLVVWDAATDKPVFELTQEGYIDVARFSPDGRRVVTASRNGKVRVYDASDGRFLLTLDHGDDQSSSVQDVEFDPEGLLIVTACADGTARVWNATTGKPIPPDVRHEGPVSQAMFSPDGRALLTVSLAADNETGVLRVWNVASRTPRTPPMKAGSQTFRGSGAALSPDGRLVVAADGLGARKGDGYGHSVLAVDGKGARVWDAATGEPVTARIDDSDALSRTPGVSNGSRSKVRGNLLMGRDFQNRLTLIGGGLTPKPPLARVWELPSDDRTAVDLVAWTQLLASRRIDSTETLIGLTPAELAARVNASRKRGELAPATTRPRAIDWNRYEAEECEMIHEFYAAAWHLSRLIEAQPSDPGLRGRRGNARAVLADWEAAAEDYRAAVQSGANDVATLVADARLRLACHDPDGYRDACARLIARFGKSDDLPTLDNVARVLALAPQNAATTAAAVALAGRAVKAETRDYRRGEYSETLAATLVRAGRSKDAAETLKKYQDKSLWCKLFAALDAAKGGETATARTLSDDASKKLDAYAKAHSLLDAVTQDDLHWSEFLVATLLKAECQQLISILELWEPP